MPAVTQIWTPRDSLLPRMLELAMAVEARSEHPLAQPVLDEAKARGATPPDEPITDFHAHAGLGVHGRVGNTWVGVGREALFESHEIPLPSGLRDQAERIRKQGQTALLVVSSEEEVCGVIGVADQLRPDAAEAIRQLKQAGARRIVMLTGDHAEVAGNVAAQVGVDAFRAGLLPEDKVMELGRLAQRDGTIVAMVGDGVNDAPALAAANIGIAMGGAGTDVALEVADVVLMGDDLRVLATAVKIGRIARSRVRQNLIFAFGMIGVLVLASFANLPLWLGVLGHEGSTVLVVMNGLRMLWQRIPK
jgi:Cd2+/Zn2+-exporting ATPase